MPTKKAPAPKKAASKKADSLALKEPKITAEGWKRRFAVLIEKPKKKKKK